MQIPEAEAKDLWDKAYDESGRTEGRVGANFGLNMRQRRIALLAGLVLPVWQVVEGALSLQARTADRRLKVIRLQTTGTAAVPLSRLLRFEYLRFCRLLARSCTVG